RLAAGRAHRGHGPPPPAVHGRGARARVQGDAREGRQVRDRSAEARGAEGAAPRPGQGVSEARDREGPRRGPEGRARRHLLVPEVLVRGGAPLSADGVGEADERPGADQPATGAHLDDTTPPKGRRYERYWGVSDSGVHRVSRPIVID